MKRLEEIRLRALVKSLRREADRLSRLSMKVYKTAGYSDMPGGTGDEGWNKSHNIGGKSLGFAYAAEELEQLLDKMEVRK